MFSRHAIARKDVSGFTLIELTIVVSLLIVVIGMGGDFIISAFQQQGYATERDTLERNSQVALYNWVHDVRTAQTADDATIDPVMGLSTTGFTFYSPDRQTPFHERKIIYQLSGSNLQRSITPSTNTTAPWTFGTTSAFVTVLPNVTALTFGYLDSTGAVTANTSKVQRVTMAISIDNDTAHSPYTQSYTLSADLRITNA